MRTVLVRLVIVVVGVLALPVTALLLDGVEALVDVLVPIAGVAAAGLGAVLGRLGLDPAPGVVGRWAAGVLWAALGFVLSLGGYALLLSSLGP